MSGPVAMLQGLCIFPRSVQFNTGNNRLTRITESWLVGENAADGPTAVHANGLWIGLGLRGAHHTFEVGFGMRHGTTPSTWTTPSGTADVTKALKKAFGENTANWKGFHLRQADLPSSGPTWNALFFRIVSGFVPTKPRDFNVVPIVVALAGGNEDTFGDAHYLLGLTVFTKSSGAVEDFMVVTHAMNHSTGHPELTIPPDPHRPKPRYGSEGTDVPRRDDPASTA